MRTTTAACHKQGCDYQIVARLPDGTDEETFRASVAIYLTDEEHPNHESPRVGSPRAFTPDQLADETDSPSGPAADSN